MSVRRIEAFLLRLVIQDDQPPVPENWRGRIQHVATGEERKIDQLQDAVAFIVARLSAEDGALIELDGEGAAPCLPGQAEQCQARKSGSTS